MCTIASGVDFDMNDLKSAAENPNKKSDSNKVQIIVLMLELHLIMHTLNLLELMGLAKQTGAPRQLINHFFPHVSVSRSIKGQRCGHAHFVTIILVKLFLCPCFGIVEDYREN